MRITKINTIILTLLLSCSVNVWSAKTINFNGSIAEETCSQKNSLLACQALNTAYKKIKTSPISTQDLFLKPEKNDLASYQVERIKSTHAVIIANYH